MAEITCTCIECVRRRESVAGIQQIKSELPKPEYDWDDLEAASQRARQDPQWYKRP